MGGEPGLYVGGRHRARLLPPATVRSRSERAAQQRRRDVHRCLGATGIAAHPGKALGAAIHDYDRDGRIDLFVANDSMQQFLFRNTGKIFFFFFFFFLGRGTFDEIALRPASPTTTTGGALPGWAPTSRTTTTMAGRT